MITFTLNNRSGEKKEIVGNLPPVGAFAETQDFKQKHKPVGENKYGTIYAPLT